MRGILFTILGFRPSVILISVPTTDRTMEDLWCLLSYLQFHGKIVYYVKSNIMLKVFMFFKLYYIIQA